MSRRVKDARLETRAAREKLTPRHEPYWRLISEGRHIGYRKGKVKPDRTPTGKWIARLHTGKGYPDVERVVMVASGEHAPGDLEQQQIEGRLEVAGELALDDGRADGPQIVGEPDAYARFLARLGLRIAG